MPVGARTTTETKIASIRGDAMPCIVIDNPAWDRDNPPGWGGPEYLQFDLFKPNRSETTLQWLTFCDPQRWFHYTVTVERKGNDLSINYALGDNRDELERCSLDESDIEWGMHILHDVVPGKKRGSSTWNDASGPGWKTDKPSQGRRNRKQSTIWAIQRGHQGPFRQQLLELDGRCAISGEVCEEALEAAHIVPAHKGGREIVTNGILLRADLHRLYDRNPPKFEICPKTGKVLPTEGFKYQSCDLSKRKIDEAIRRRISEALRRRQEGER